MQFLRVRELVRKEFIQLFRDKRNRPLLVIAPLVQLLVFGYVVSTDVRTVAVGLLDQSKTAESRLVAHAFSANKTFEIVFATENPRELESYLLKRNIDIAIKIPRVFSERIRRGETANIQILADGSASNMASVRIAYTKIVIDRLNKKIISELYSRRRNNNG